MRRGSVAEFPSRQICGSKNRGRAAIYEYLRNYPNLIDVREIHSENYPTGQSDG